MAVGTVQPNGRLPLTTTPRHGMAASSGSLMNFMAYELSSNDSGGNFSAAAGVQSAVVGSQNTPALSANASFNTLYLFANCWVQAASDGVVAFEWANNNVDTLTLNCGSSMIVWTP